jgi:predicted acetylornithine/succinylornithine family transaminase
MDNYGSPPRLFVEGSGTEVWDKDGNRYLDFLGGLAVVALGHSHPDVAAAVANQAVKLTHTSNLFANEHQAPVAETLISLIGCGQGQILFQNSGAESNEAAIKLARKSQGPDRHVVVSALGSFHGRTLATLAATGQPAKHTPFQPMPTGFTHVPYNDIEALTGALGPEVAAVILEPIQGEGGVVPARAGYLEAVRQATEESGVLLIIDEIQTGIGRTGAWFGFQHSGIEPDIVTMAKALGNGLPVGAVWARDEVSSSFGPGDHGSTFAGQPIPLAAARATLNACIAMDAPSLASEMGRYLEKEAARHAWLSGSRGSGLLLALEIEKRALGGHKAADLAKACLEHGLIVNGVTPTALRLAPPLTTTREQINEAIEIIDESISSLKGRS